MAGNSLSRKTGGIVLIVLPRRPMGRPTLETISAYDIELVDFCRRIKELRSGLDFDVSSRGWCYVLEEYGLKKGNFDQAQKLINDCRKSGLLPLDICKEDGARAFDNVESITDESPTEYAEGWVEYLDRVHLGYRPFSFWDSQKFYVQMLVEKIDVKSLFSPVCAEFFIPIANVGGWADINVRAEVMRRFAKWHALGKICVLLYFGDHDPGGLNISDMLRSNLRDLEGAVGWSPTADNLKIDRFGLNADFIKREGLTWIDNLSTSKGKYPLNDPRHEDHKKPYVQNYLKQFGARKVEANALVVPRRVEAGRELCRSAILKYVQARAPQIHNRKLAVTREAVRQDIARLMSGSAS